MSTSEMDIPVPGGVLTLCSTYTEVHGVWDWDPDWSFTDREGHRHACEPGSSFAERFPTLQEVPEPPFYCPDCREVHDDFTHVECRECGEPVFPGRIPGPPLRVLTSREFRYRGPLPRDIAVELVRRSAPQLSDMTINGQPVTRFLEEL